MSRALIVVTALLLSGCAQVMEGETRKLGTMRVQEALSGYEAASRKGDMLDMCVKAKLVAIAYADGKDLANSEAWKARERETCAAVMAAYGVTPPAAADQ
jgi:hypothetical protein